MRLEGHLKQLELWKDGRTPTDGKDYDPEKDVMLHILNELVNIRDMVDAIRQGQGR